MTTGSQSTPRPALQVEQATVELGGRPVLRRVDLRVDSGQLVALLGTNGSGKSTLVRASLGLLPLLSGSVEMFGTPLERFHDWRRVGYVPQRPSVASGVPATVREVVATGRLARRRAFQLSRADDRAAVERALTDVRLADRADDSVAELSGGQSQRVMIARALAGDPHLLVLDEPTAGVDAETQQLLASLLAELVAGGAAVLLVAHELGPLEQLIDRCVVLLDGTVAFTGPPESMGAAGAGDLTHAHSSEPDSGQLLHGEGMWR